MIIIPNQPINFKFCDNCDCLGIECFDKNQIAEYDDYFSFQIEDPELFLGEELLLDAAGDWIGDFEDEDPGPPLAFVNWQNSADGGNDWDLNNVAPLDGTYDALANGGATTNILYNITDMIGITTGNYLRLSVLHSEIPDGCELNIYYNDGGGGGFVLLITVPESDKAAGTFYYDFIAPANIKNIGFEYEVISCEEDLHIDNVSIKKYDLTLFKIYECCEANNLIGVLDADGFTITDDYITFIGQWSDYIIIPGLYKICIDDVDMIQNGTFTHTLDNWVNIGSNTEWAIVSSQAKVSTIESNLISDILTQYIDLPAKCDFRLEFELDTNVTGDFYVYVNGEIYYSISPIAIGNFSTTINKRNESVTSVGFKVVGTSPGYCILDNVHIYTDICSDCLNIDEEYDCSLYLTATQSNDAFGFGFDGTFIMYQRFFADLFKYTPEFDQVNTRDSDGTNSQIYADFLRTYELKIYRIGGYLWNALEVMAICNTFKIDGMQYIKKEGTIELDWDNKREFASGTIEVNKRLENNQNTYS